jgi:hypothetical protein
MVVPGQVMSGQRIDFLRCIRGRTGMIFLCSCHEKPVLSDVNCAICRLRSLMRFRCPNLFGTIGRGDHSRPFATALHWSWKVVRVHVGWILIPNLSWPQPVNEERICLPNAETMVGNGGIVCRVAWRQTRGRIKLGGLCQ